jgi:hypothetical protein
MTALSALIGKFAAMLDADPANEGKLLEWIEEARAAMIAWNGGSVPGRRQISGGEVRHICPVISRKLPNS